MNNSGLRAEIETSASEILSPVAAIAIALALVAAAYTNSLWCGFVWDDNRQIVANYLIQDPRFIGEALRSDVWAFNAQRVGSVSNYWRPATVLWMIFNYQFFKLNAVGWHVMSVLLHAFVTVFVYLVVRQLGASVLVAAASAWLFAVHPVHVESVSWCAASVDLQIAAGMFPAFWLYLRSRDPIRPGGLLLATVFYSFAIFSKETAILFPCLVAGMEWILTPRVEPIARRVRRIAIVTMPFVAVAVLYLVLRFVVAGITYRNPVQALSWRQLAVFLPQGIVYYLRQSILPIFVAPMNSLLPKPGGAHIWLWTSPVVLAVTVALAIRFWRRDALTAFAFICFALFLTLPLLNARACPPDERVHDRYLYVPVLGIILLATQRLSERVSAWPFLIAAGLLSAVFTVMTINYNRAWRNELALWERAVADCPTCSEAHVRLGSEYRRLNRHDDAVRVIDAGLSSADPGYVGSVLMRAMLFSDAGDYESAEQRYRTLIAQVPENPTPYEQLAKTLADQRRFIEAIEMFEAARKQFPLQDIRYGTNIAVIAYQAGELDRATAELEGLRTAIDQYRDPTYLKYHALLGEIYARMGRVDNAISAYQHFLEMTSADADPATVELRSQARTILDQLRTSRR